MKIKYFGHSCFVLQYKNFSVCIDPFSGIGLKEPYEKTDYYFCSHDHYDHNNYKVCNGKPLSEKVGYKLITTFHDKEMGAKRGKNDVLVLNEEITLAHLGDLGEVTADLIEKLKGIDVLLCPIGGNYTIDYKEAICLINEVKPKIAVPMHYKYGDSTIDIDRVDNFLNNVDFSIKKYINEIDINKGELPKQTQIALLEVNR